MKARVLAAAAALALCLARALGAQQLAEVTYEHYDQCRNIVPRPDGCTLSQSVRLSPGGTLRVWVKHTNAADFSVDVHGYTVRTTAGSAAPAMRAVAGEEAGPEDSVSLELTHNARYGGYVVTITPNRELPLDGTASRGGADRTGPAKVPGPAVLVLTVEGEEPDHLFSGGISFTSVTSEVFVARAPVAPDTTYTVAADADNRDAASVAFATFVNVRMPWRPLGRVWPGLGIGLETDGNPQYYLGVGFRMAKSVFVNVGGVLGRVDALPAGLDVGDAITDPNVLANLPHRSQLGFYLGMSFTFLGGGQEAFAKPFAGTASK